MRQSIFSGFQPIFPMQSPFSNLLSFFNGQASQPTMDPSLTALFSLNNALKEKTIVNLEKGSTQSQSEQGSVAEIKQEEFCTKKEDQGLINAKPVQCSDGSENRMAMWLDVIRQFKMFNPLVDYNLMNGYFMQQANILKEFNNYTANLQLLQKHNENSNHVKSVEVKRAEKLNGVYTKEQRLLKIKYYKEKKNKWRAKHPINRGFIGRKMVAKAKPRIRGKFVKKTSMECLKENME